MARDKKTGCSICLDEETHKAAWYRKTKDRVILERAERLSSEELRSMAKKARSVAVCFSPRTIYADLGEFSCVTNEATLAHIRSTIDKTGLFNADYAVAFTKIHEIDKVRAKFSYLAVPAGDIDRIAVLDENQTFLDIYCPIEAALASTVAGKTPEMTLTIFEDHRYVRIIGSKQSVIYSLITINKYESFDLPAETASGIREMISLLRNSYNESAQHIYTIGLEELSLEDLEEKDIHAEIFSLGKSDGGMHPDSELMGTICTRGYDFTPRSFKLTKQRAAYARYSTGISAIMILLSFLLFGFGTHNSQTARLYENKLQEAQRSYLQNLSALEKDYTELCKELDFTNINGIISMYEQFEAEPKLYTILGSITQKVPGDISLTRIEITRPGGDTVAASPGLPGESTPRHSTLSDSLHVEIAGVIGAAYPQSKRTFSSFMSQIQETYTVSNATFQQSEKSAAFSMECETRP